MYSHPKGKGSGQYNGMQKAGDWVGKRIIAACQLRNGGGQGVAPGMQGIVTGTYRGLSVTFDVCKHCGTVMHVSKLHYTDVELFEHVDALDLTAWTPDELRRRLVLEQEQNTQLRELTSKLIAALQPFADAFEKTGIHGYKGADEKFAEFLDRNQITPSDSLSMKEFKLAWEAVHGHPATN